MTIAAVIPSYNNEETVGRVVRETMPYVAQVFVIDDGSTDETAHAARAAGARVVRVQRNRGKGHALRVGFRCALKEGFEAVVTLDADGQHDPAEIPRFIERYRRTKALMVVGNRMEGRLDMPRVRYGPNLIGTYTFSWLIGRPVPDSQCGFRLYDRMVMERLRILNNGFEAEADLLLRAGKRGYAIEFVPVKSIYFQGPGSLSHFRAVRDTFRICIIFLMNLFWKNR
ncbi:MAG: glycosyltransferase family 2 protein [Deltaproteobacteria bacterium]|nr:glycosyltransferase family 2 protein [Deltaproteobacteria bacterium]MBW1923697.1 glycosyltransferase family 2 protein [Deltaproteobacteria bacterium]